jgi:hypothetical protein
VHNLEAVKQLTSNVLSILLCARLAGCRDYSVQAAHWKVLYSKIDGPATLAGDVYIVVLEEAEELYKTYGMLRSVSC